MVLPRATIFLLVFVLFFTAEGRGRANDSTAEGEAGGLVLVQAGTISMAREDLRISLDRIAIRYVFRNTGTTDRSVRVAFSLPPLTGYATELTATVLPRPGDANFVGFTVQVDGQSVTPRLEERAFLGEEDVTATLQRAGMPLNPFAPQFARSVKALDVSTRKALKTADLLAPEMGEAAWRYEAKFFFDMTFPAGKDVVVTHDYTPVAGTYQLLESNFDGDPSFGRFCVDPPTRGALGGLIRRATAGGRHGRDTRVDPLSGTAWSRAVSYILTTANNWSGPIGHFHLTVDKGRPDTVISTCFHGLRKTSPTSFEFEADDYPPREDLLVLFSSDRIAKLDAPR